MVAFLYKPEVQAKEESQRAADVNPLVLAPRLCQLRVCGVPFLAFITQAVSFTLVQLISGSSASSLTVPEKNPGP